MGPWVEAVASFRDSDTIGRDFACHAGYRFELDCKILSFRIRYRKLLPNLAYVLAVELEEWKYWKEGKTAKETRAQYL